MAKRTRTSSSRWTGLILVVLLLVPLANQRADFAIVIGLSVALVLWSLFMAPTWCGAANRREGEFCRNNSWGPSAGCHLREHRLQKLRMIFIQHRWAHLTKGMWSTPAAVLATISGIFGVVAPLIEWLK